MAQKDIEMYAQILNESDDYKKESSKVALLAEAKIKELEEDEFDKLEDEVIDPHQVGFVDSEVIDAMDEADPLTQEYEYGEIQQNARMDLDFEGDSDMFEQFCKVIHAFLKENHIPESKLTLQIDPYRCSIHLEGCGGILKDIYAMFNGFDTAEELDSADDVVPFDDFAAFDYMHEDDFDDVDIDEDDEVVQPVEEGGLDSHLDEDLCHVTVEVRADEANEFRKILRQSINNVTTCIDSTRGDGFDGKSAFVTISGPLENVKNAYAFWLGVDGFQSMTADQIGEFDNEVEFEDGDSLQEADFREKISHDLDKYGIKASTANLQKKDDASGISVVEELEKKIAELQRRLDESGIDDDLSKKAKAIGVLAGKYKPFSDADLAAFNDLLAAKDDESAQEAVDMLQKAVDAEQDKIKKAEFQRILKSTQDYQELVKDYDTFKAAEKSDDGKLNYTGFADPEFKVVKHASNWYVGSDGHKHFIKNDVMTRDQWDQYDALLAQKKSGKDLTPSQQELWDSLIDQIKHATISDQWTMVSPKHNSKDSRATSDNAGDVDDEDSVKEYGTKSQSDDNDDYGAGLATQDFGDVAYANRNAKDDVAAGLDDDNGIYQGQIPTFNPFYTRDDATDVRSISKQQKKLNAAQKEYLHDKALAVAKKNRGNPELWTMKDWQAILLGLSDEERKSLYDELMDWTIKSGANLSNEQAAIKKLFGRERFTSNRSGGSMNHQKDMTADQIKAANRAKQKESSEYLAMFTVVRSTLHELSKKYNTDKFLSAMLVKIEELYNLAYVMTPAQWNEEAKDLIDGNAAGWKNKGYPPEWLNLDNLVDKNGNPKIDKKTGEPKEPKMYVNFPSKFDVSKNMFGIMLPLIVKHVAGDPDMTADWVKYMAVNGPGTTNLKIELKKNKEAEDKINPPKTRAKRKQQTGSDTQEAK